MSDPRRQAIEVLYGVDVLGSDAAADDADLSPKARRLVTGVLAHRAELDAALEAVSDHWRVDRMPTIDRAILRVGLYELRYETDTPAAVILAEAVAHAKELSTEKSGRFVNGVLGALAGRERPT